MYIHRACIYTPWPAGGTVDAHSLPAHHQRPTRNEQKRPGRNIASAVVIFCSLPPQRSIIHVCTHIEEENAGSSICTHVKYIAAEMLFCACSSSYITEASPNAGITSTPVERKRGNVHDPKLQHVQALLHFAKRLALGIKRNH